MSSRRRDGSSDRHWPTFPNPSFSTAARRRRYGWRVTQRLPQPRWTPDARPSVDKPDSAPDTFHDMNAASLSEPGALVRARARARNAWLRFGSVATAGSNGAGSTWWGRWGCGCRATRSTPSPATTPGPTSSTGRPNAAIYIDGPPHDAPDQAREGRTRTRALIEAGYIVIRFHYADDWPAVFRRHADVFGTASE